MSLCFSVDGIYAVLEFGMVSDDTMNIVLNEGSLKVFNGKAKLNQMVLTALAKVKLLS